MDFKKTKREVVLSGPGKLTQDDYGRETLKPKVFGWAANRRFRIVDFPEPDGPEMTIGRRSGVAAGRTIRSGSSDGGWGGEPVGVILVEKRPVVREVRKDCGEDLERLVTILVMMWVNGMKD